MPEVMARRILNSIMGLITDIRLFNKDGKKAYYPIVRLIYVSLTKVFPNDFWLLKGHMVEINSTTKSLPLHIDVYPTSVMRPDLIS
jgi:hypothetical protein